MLVIICIPNNIVFRTCIQLIFVAECKMWYVQSTNDSHIDISATSTGPDDDFYVFFLLNFAVVSLSSGLLLKLSGFLGCNL